MAAEFEARWWESMDALGDLRPQDIPHATQYIEDMVALVGDLIARGWPTRRPTGSTSRSSKVEGYGLLAQQSLESLQAGARVEANEDKRSPLDFALWKKAKEGEPSWDSPWGPGRPGWHTECVVMSLDLLGEGFDLHGGGQDLMFPHHENERAQAVADGKAFARHWMHNGWVEVEGTKMSKSLGNFTTLPDLLARARRPRLPAAGAARPLPLADRGDARDAGRRREGAGPAGRAGPALRTSADCWRGRPTATSSRARRRPTGVDPGALAAFRAHMDDDLDTPGALAGIFELVTAAHSAADAGDEEEGGRLAHTAAVLAAALGLSLRAADTEVDEESARLVAERDEARAARDFARADALRDELVARGWTVEDTPNGTAIRR